MTSKESNCVRKVFLRFWRWGGGWGREKAITRPAFAVKKREKGTVQQSIFIKICIKIYKSNSRNVAKI
jgi:hypothetical protein